MRCYDGRAVPIEATVYTHHFHERVLEAYSGSS
jgi:hypothetical protein